MYNCFDTSKSRKGRKSRSESLSLTLLRDIDPNTSSAPRRVGLCRITLTQHYQNADSHPLLEASSSRGRSVFCGLHGRTGKEVMQGKIAGDTFIVTGAFSLPVEGTETRMNAQDEAKRSVDWSDSCLR